MLRPVYELVDCDSDDENVFKVSLIDRYAARPPSLESMCLADFASEYIPCAEHCKNRSATVIRLKNASNRVIGYMMKRKKPAVIRYPSFKRGEEKQFRSKLMLFVPWRNEVEDLYGEFSTYSEHYVAEQLRIRENESRFVKNGKELDQAIEDLHKAYENGAVENGWDAVAPSAVADNCECEAEGPEEVNFFNEHVVLFKQQNQKKPENNDSCAELRARFTTKASERINENPF